MTATTKSRRPRGSGLVRNRGTDRNPRWFAGYSVSIDGKRKQISRGPFPRKADAELWLRDELRRKSDGRAIVPKRITVAEMCDQWLTVKRRGLSANTAESYAGMIAQRIRPHIGHVRITELRPDHVAAMLDRLRAPGADMRARKIGGVSGVRDIPSDKGLSETSIQHAHGLLITILNWAVRQRMVAHNAAADIDRPKREKSRMQVWDDHELRAFLAVDDRLAPLFRLLACTGMRRSEVLGLWWRDVDLEARTVAVRRARVRVASVLQDRESGKTAAATRVIDLDPTTVTVLRRWRRDQKAERLAWGPAWADTAYVFTAEDGQPIGTQTVDGRFRRLTKTAGVPTIRLHDLRHTHASLMLKAGVPVHVVSRRLGHASAALTLSVYSHVLPTQQAEAAAAFSALVDGVR